jgi:alkylation response protein AidB-like acyl-CoA dehydrogenase
MDFTLTETQSLLKDTAERLVREKYTFDDRKKIVAADTSYSKALWDEFAALGLLGVEIDEECGGIGGSFADLAIVLEAFGRGLVVEPYLSTVVVGAGLINAAVKGDQRKNLLTQVAAGTLTLALAHGEAKARYSLEHVETRARKDGSDYVINGAKAVVLGGDTADKLIVSARTDGEATDRNGITLFLVDGDAAGIHKRIYRNMDDRGAAEITFENVRVPESAVLGAVGAALALVEAANDRAAAALCCEGIGAMKAVNEITLEYLKTRNQFGRPIGKFQVLQHRMADMAMAEEQARSMVYLAVDFANEADAAERAAAISAAKVQIANSGQIVGRGAVQLHGGIGMTIELVVGHYMRRLTCIEKMFGDIDWHIDRFAAA